MNVDIARYNEHPDCELLYDPDAKISNPKGLINDLEKNNPKVKVIINDIGNIPMAKYIVKQSSTAILDNGNGYLNIYLLCELINSGGNPRIFKFRIVPDETYPDINMLNNIIKYGFSFAEINKKKIEYSEFPERLYLNFSLPSLPDGRLRPYRFSGEEQINTKGHN